MTGPAPSVPLLGDCTRTPKQNRRMWAMLNDLARQVHWPVDGVMQLLDPEDWKHVMSAGLKKHQRVAAGIEGGFVILGQHTSKFSRREMADLITLMFAFGGDKGVNWTDPKQVADLVAWAEEIQRKQFRQAA